MGNIKENKLWFRAKRYGWGWYPCSWQGWLVIVVWVILFTLSMVMIQKNDPEIGKNIGIIIILTAILIYVSWLKGEKPGWNWGKKNGKN